jgi:hypothetical protein
MIDLPLFPGRWYRAAYERRRIAASLGGMSLVQCPSCNAVYERTVRAADACTAGSFQCSCGHLLAQWHGWQAIEFRHVEAAARRPVPRLSRGSRKPDASIMILDVLTGK